MRILVTNDDGIHAEGLDVCEQIARALSDDVWVIAPEYDQSGVAAFAVAQRSAAAAPGRRAALCGARHADRLRHHGRAPRSQRQGTRSRALRRQPRAQRRRGRDLFRHRRRRDGRHVLGIPSFALSQAYAVAQRPAALLGDGDASMRPTSSAACSPRASRATCSSTSTFPIARRTRSRASRLRRRAQARQERLHIDERRDGRGNPVLLDHLCTPERRQVGAGRDRSRRARRALHRGDAARARHDRRAVHDEARRAIRVRTTH